MVDRRVARVRGVSDASARATGASTIQSGTHATLPQRVYAPPHHVACSARSHLDSTQIAPAALDKISSLHTETIREIEEAVRNHDVVVVGMAQNSSRKPARR